MNLYEFSATTRRVIVYAAVGLVLFIVLRILYGLAVNLYLSIYPPLEPSPTVGFGKLPKLQLPSLTVSGSPTYSLETPTGVLPEFSDRSEVVAAAEFQPSLLGEDEARALAQNLNFGGEGALSADNKTLTFRDATDGRILAVDVVSQNFTLSTDANHIGALSKGAAPSGPDAIKGAQDFLSNLGLLKFGFEAGNQTTTFRAATGGVIKEAGSISEAQLTEVNFFRSLTGVGKQTYSILTANPKQGLIQVWITTDLHPDVLNILRISYNAAESELNKNKVETYPLRNVAEAWQDIQKGKGIAYIGIKGNLKTVEITSVDLSYFDDATYQKYLQPIYVFSGVAKTANGSEGEFTAYVQAVSKDWITE